MPEDECVEHGLTRRVEGPVQRDVAAGLSAAAVQAVDVAVDPLHQEVNARTDSAGGVKKHRVQMLNIHSQNNKQQNKGVVCSSNC